MFKRLSNGLTSLELVQIIVGKRFDQKSLCKVKPEGVAHNATFIVDLNHVSLKDLGADDNGAWNINQTQWFALVVMAVNLNCF